MVYLMDDDAIERLRKETERRGPDDPRFRVEFVESGEPINWRRMFLNWYLERLRQRMWRRWMDLAGAIFGPPPDDDESNDSDVKPENQP